MNQQSTGQTSRPEVPQARDALNNMKYEIARELGLLDRVREVGWAGLTAKETGRIGGLMGQRKKQH